MKRSVLFCRTARCTGCLLCEMACSVRRTGRCSRSGSLIHILTHPRFGTSQPVVSPACEEEDCDLRCTQICTADVLRFAPEREWAELLADPDWMPAPILPTTMEE